MPGQAAPGLSTPAHRVSVTSGDKQGLKETRSETDSMILELDGKQAEEIVHI